MKGITLFFLIALAISAILFGCRYADEAREVTWQETRPMALMKKYRFFKDLQASIDARQADIEAKKKSLARLEARIARREHAGRDTESLQGEQSLQEQEVYGLIASYNAMAADYNRRMADIGYQFCNRGQMPQGLEGETSLKRSFATYKTD